MAHSKEIHVLMVALHYHGHINPILWFAKLLVSKGLYVTITTTEYGRSLLPNDLSQHEAIKFEFFADGLDINLDRDENLDILLNEYLPRDGAKNLSNLISNLEGEDNKKFSCIISDGFMPWVANVATTHNIPCAMLWVQSCATYSIYYHYYKKLFNFPSLDDPNNTFEIPGLPLMKVEDLPTYFLTSSLPHLKKLISSTINNMDQFQWIFGCSFHELEYNFIQSMAKFKPIVPIGPLVPPLMLQKEVTNQESEEEIDIWLNKRSNSSVLYISLGTISVLSEKETQELAIALENDTSRRFLWVRKKGKKGWGKNMGDLPKGFSEKTKDRGLVVSWCNQGKVLMHPAIQCFLTHCGWNSTLEAVTAGVPVIAYPDCTDQVTNAKLLVDVFNVGVRMRKNKDGEINKEEVERCIKEVSEGPRAVAMKEKAIKWKEAAKNATSTGGSSDVVIDKFISEIKGKITY